MRLAPQTPRPVLPAAARRLEPSAWTEQPNKDREGAALIFRSWIFSVENNLSNSQLLYLLENSLFKKKKEIEG